MNRLVTMTVGVFQPYRYVKDPTCPPCPRHGKKGMVDAVIVIEHQQLPVYICITCQASAKSGEGVYMHQPQPTFDTLKQLMESKWLDTPSGSVYVN